ncbi:MAG: imidazoleglycerol-phosphate dehydratase HisB [Nitrososphaeria archaeon]|jgi:imidazoleglycerol-phosphate dehydratase
MRTSTVERKTKETEIKIKLNIDGDGKTNIDTSIRFLDHLLCELAVHSYIDLEIKAKGDLSHHIVEDVAITLGEALRQALGDRNGIKRFGYSIVPMDDALALVSIDLVTRQFSDIELDLWSGQIEDMASEDIPHFIETLANSLKFTLHVNVLRGTNNHHKVEAVFKGLALSLSEAWEVDRKRKGIPSSKGKM